MGPELVLRTGELVEITYRGKTVIGVVSTASANGRSLFVEYNDLLGGYLCGMPILFVERGDGEFHDLFVGDLVELRRIELVHLEATSGPCEVHELAEGGLAIALIERSRVGPVAICEGCIARARADAVAQRANFPR